MSPRHANWLSEDVFYLISEKEKTVFLNLETDRDRDLFIEAFWRQRDPVPQTPENEYREEHYRRLGYAKANFGKTGIQPGWKTDRGRVHIILGNPVQVTSYGDEARHLVPVEVWFYQGNFGSGLPANFSIVFFQEEGLGDYILFSPIRHGPKKLLESYDGPPGQALSVLSRIEPELALLSQSLIPGAAPLSNQASLASEVILKKISVLPQKRIDDAYAEKWLKYKSIIEVDHSVNYIPSDLLLKVIADRSTCFVHYAVVPQRLSVGSAAGENSVRLEIYGRVSDLEGRTVFQYQRRVSFDPSAEEAREMRTKRFSYQDAFPLIPGRFKFDVLMKNPLSGEFTSAECPVIIPENSGSPGLSSLILATRVQTDVGFDSPFRPFRMDRAQIFPSPSRVFGSQEKVWACWKAEGLSPDLRRDGRIRMRLFQEERQAHASDLPLPESAPSGFFHRELPVDGLPPGIYRLVVELLDGGQQVVSALKEDFSRSHVEAFPSIWSISERLPHPDDPFYPYVLGMERLSQEQLAEAKSLLEKSYSQKPESLEFALGLGQACLALKEYSRVREVLVRFLERAKEEPRIYHFLGSAAFFENDPGTAAYYFKKYLAQFGTNLEVLNLLASSLYQTGNREEALAAWRKSLEIAPRQEEIQKKVQELEKR